MTAVWVNAMPTTGASHRDSVTLAVASSRSPVPRVSSSIAVAGAFGALHGLALPLARLRLLTLPFYGGLLVEGPPLHLLEDAFLQHVFLQGLEGRLDLIRVDIDPGRGDDPAHAQRPAAGSARWTVRRRPSTSKDRKSVV